LMRLWFLDHATAGAFSFRNCSEMSLQVHGIVALIVGRRL
jgi:hypothetical protein